MKASEIHCRSTGVHSPKEDPFTLLAELRADALLLRRLEIADMPKQLEEERKEIDAE